MAFIQNFLHAIATGAATITLSPSLPHVDITPKSSASAFAEDASKLKGDFDAALSKLPTELKDRGTSVASKA